MSPRDLDSGDSLPNDLEETPKNLDKPLFSGEELVIAPQSRVKPAALVVDHAVVAIRQSPERNGWSLDVLEKGLEGLTVACH